MQDVDAFAFGRFRMDLTRRLLLVDGQAVALHARAFDVLEYLVASRKRVVTRDEIVNHVWRGVVVGENNLSVQMSTLRRVLAANGGADLIVTVPHRGYQFVERAAGVPIDVDVATAPRPLGSGNAKRVNAEGRAFASRRWPVLGAAAVMTFFIAVTVAWRTVWSAHLPSEASAGHQFHPPPHSIAVLAFSNMSGDPRQEYLSDGLSEELMESLSQVRALQVTGRTSSFFFKGKSATILDIAKTLNVSAILEGSLRRQGSHLRIEARLTDARTGYQLWSRPFDSDLQDMLKMEMSIAGAVTDALQVTLGSQPSGLVRGGSTNADAIDAFLHGLEENRHPALASYRAALTNFNAAIALDPAYAFAYVGKALSLTFIAGIGDASDVSSPLYRDALAAASRAVELAPDHGATHIARAMVLANGYLNFREAWSEAREAERLTPGDAPVDLLFGVIAAYVGHMDEALSAARRAVSLDPLHEDAWMELGWILRLMHNYDGALSAYQHAGAIGTPRLPTLRLERASTFIAMGKPEQARTLCEGGMDWELLECQAIVDHATGRQGDAVKAFDSLRQTMGDNLAYVYAEIHAQWGEPEEAMRWLARAKTLNDSGLALIKTDPLLDPIRAKPGFAALVTSLNFPE